MFMLACCSHSMPELTYPASIALCCCRFTNTKRHTTKAKEDAKQKSDAKKAAKEEKKAGKAVAAAAAAAARKGYEGEALNGAKDVGEKAATATDDANGENTNTGEGAG